ncbi:hypothetical protein EI77_00494 [Prosthecobacter fusiformis]|uniref:Uncharacterized protein n=1 Tax=Prosthecobacter fusiformis TaxID=48464 RepID=A0A4R7SQ98_9BACT|nr:hypothetical protein EI77_00494 [Prosthecobacter fusiformis]
MDRILGEEMWGGGFLSFGRVDGEVKAGQGAFGERRDILRVGDCGCGYCGAQNNPALRFAEVLAYFTGRILPLPGRALKRK